MRDASAAARRLARTGTAILVVFSAAATLLTWQLREAMLAGLVARDAEVFASVVQLRLAPIESELVLGNDLPRDVLLVERLLEVTSLRGVLGLRLYDEAGVLTHAVPDTFLGHAYDPATLTAPSSDRQKPDEPAAEYIAGDSPADWFTRDHAGAMHAAPLLRIRLPLRLPVTGESLGTAEFLLDGSTLADQRRALDRHLLTQAGLLIGTALLLGAGVQRWAWVRLRRHAETLAAQQHRLIRTNAELALAVKSSAIGAVTAHLLHDLKASLAGLEAFVAAGNASPSALDAEDWRAAHHAARSMRHLVAEIAGILHSIETGEGVDLDAAELMTALHGRHSAYARQRQVELACLGQTDAPIDGRQSQLVLLVLSNLVRNAIEATPAGGCVVVHVAREGTTTSWRVSDTGPGVPEERQPHLFQPVRSTKADGGGIGLAISAQIAAHLHASLRLASTGAGGSVFELTLPASPFPSA